MIWYGDALDCDRLGFMGLVEEDWIETLGTVDPLHTRYQVMQATSHALIQAHYNSLPGLCRGGDENCQAPLGPEL